MVQAICDMFSERHPPLCWPQGTRIAAVLTFDFQGEVGSVPLPGGKKNFREITEFSYGARVGIWRILDLLDKHGVKATFPTCGATAEIYPEAAREILKRGHEVAAHAYEHELLYQLNREEELAVINKTVQAIERVIGQRPLGWRSPIYWATENTVELLCQTGFAWHSDFHNDDVPYILEVKGGQVVEIPPSLDDWGLYYGMGMVPTAPRGVPRNILTVFQDAFDVLYWESERIPKMFQVCMHPLIMGKPQMIKVLDSLIKYVKGFPGVWFARCIDVTRLLIS